MHHYYYGDPKSLDLTKIREEAVAYSKGDDRNAPVLVSIHFHKKDERCFGREHEDYKDGEKVVSEH